jgi:photosystem II stability/assembly factor-like uncharacterized protein
MQTKTLKGIERKKKRKVNALFAVSFFLSLSIVSFSLVGCGSGGGGGGGVPFSASGGTVNPAFFSGWEMTNGPFSGIVFSLAVDPKNPRKIYAALESGGLFTSGDGGSNWTHVEGNLNNVSISVVDVHVDSRTIYVGTGAHGVYKSSDGGKTWAQVSNGLPVDLHTGDYYEIFGITIDPTNANTVYALSGDCWYICVTTDGGGSWTRVDGGAQPQGGLPWDRIEEFAIHPNNSQWLYVGTYTNGVYKSEDMGATWHSINGNPAGTGLPAYVVNVPCLAIDGANDIVYAGTRDYGLWKTLDDGVTWDFVEVGPCTVDENWDAYVLAMDPIDKSTIYTHVVTVQPVQPAEDGIYRTFDGGKNWEKVPFHEYPDTYRPVRDIAIAPSDGNVVYVTTHRQGLFMTDDAINVANVDDWQSIDNGLVDLPVYAIMLHPYNNKIVHAGTSSGLFKTTDGGLKWERKGFQGETVFALVAHESDLNTIYAATDDGVYKTTDGGDTWSGPRGYWFYSLALGKGSQNRNILYGGNPAGMGIYRAVDDGSKPWDQVTWEEKNNGLTDDEKNVQCVAIDPLDSSVLYAGTGYRLWPGPITAGNIIKTSDGGDTWQRKVVGLPPDEPICSLTIDLFSPQNLYSGSHLGFYASSDAGDTWRFKDGGLGQRHVRAIAIDPRGGKKVCAGTYEDGVFASADRGENWALIDQGLTGDLNKRILCLAMDLKNVDNPVVYAGTGCGVFKAYK